MLFAAASSCVALSVAGCGTDDGGSNAGSDAGGSSSSSSSGETTSGGSSGASGSSSSGGSGDGGASSSSSGDSGVVGEWTATCDAQAAHGLSCNPDSTLAAETQDCLDESACFDAALRPGAAAALSECLNARACKVSDDACFSQVGSMLVGRAVQIYSTECTAKRDACKGSFKDDWCDTAIGVYKDEMFTAAQACLSGSCESMAACFDAVQAMVPACAD